MNLFETLQHQPVLYLSSVCILGLIVGSFLNVVIHRLPLMLKQQWRSDCEEFLADDQDNKAPDTTIKKQETSQETGMIQIKILL